ncbi:MAG: glycoside hydrolase family 140 protein [Verrucomicrobiota bacterium]
MNKRFVFPFVAALAALGAVQCHAGALPPIRVNAGGHYLETADGRPFFWLGDTGWLLIHSLTRDECSYYLRTRAQQGFNLVQVMVIGENDLTDTNLLGERPFINNDPAHPNDAYFDRVAEIADEAASNGLYLALLPAWGDQLTAPWGGGPRVFRNDNLPVVHAYAAYLGRKLKSKSNVVWMLGGDRPAKLDGSQPDAWPQTIAKSAGFAADYDWRPIWREFAAGITDGAGGTPLFLYHPQGGSYRTSKFLSGESWLSVNAMQSGHGGGHDIPVWDWVAEDYALQPPKPTLDLEPNYEESPYNPWPQWDPATGYFTDYDVRKQTYRSVFAGACGVTYGDHCVWQFAGARSEVINHAVRDWKTALLQPGARGMRCLRDLVESRPFFSRVPDQSLIAGDPGKGGLHLQATRDTAGSYAFIYFPMNDQSAEINLARLRAKTVRAWWYDPRTGIGTLIGEFPGGATREFRTPPQGPDWVLVLDDADSHYAAPGLKAFGK